MGTNSTPCEERPRGDKARERALVLIVDDDEDIRETLRFALEEETGFEVIEAQDGLIALEVLRALDRRAVVISNHQMPRLDGPGLFAFILDDPDLAAHNAYFYITAATRVIGPSFQRQLDRLHATVVRKPFDVFALIALVEQAAARLRAQGAEGTQSSA